MAPQDPEAAALLAHVVAQIEQNVNFLASQNYISQTDASSILTKLPNVANNNNTSGINGLAARVSNMMGRDHSTPGTRAPPPPAPVRSTLPQVKALWAYSGDDADDLSFQPGDIIDVVEETNADWWTGRVHGKQGLFPSGYVERIAQQPLVDNTAAPAAGAGATGAPRAYKPFGAAYHGVAAPPPPGQGVNNSGLQEAPGTEEKKDKFGKYKSTLAHSAVGGVGFGAGSAIGGGLVRAIF
ncbi:hypothetical protein M413DRAFT_447389 [Hebeloma cylindrosporum]|uniref:SH3 domain-containing protein n=1 Tax=Hebeloma cylindrosporum TaxID=76867 RepID=A0A0C2XMW4_HEBCY|nr:hypothetical protein M413DRAFT_447389 [Hebeloma cylindrosporum h7]